MNRQDIMAERTAKEFERYGIPRPDHVTVREAVGNLWRFDIYFEVGSLSTEKSYSPHFLFDSVSNTVCGLSGETVEETVRWIVKRLDERTEYPVSLEEDND